MLCLLLSLAAQAAAPLPPSVTAGATEQALSNDNNTQDDEAYEDFAINPHTMPRKAPRFDAYPAPAYHGQRARLQVRGADRMYRTRLRWAYQAPVNFAGHYVLARWGCGYSCVTVRIIDVRSGKVLPTQGLGSVDFHRVSNDVLEPSSALPEDGPLKFRANSRLLVVLGAPEEDDARHGIAYYVLEGERLRLLQRIHIRH